MAFGFAKQSGGHLRVHSRLGWGTTVRFYLPRVQTAMRAEVRSTPEASPGMLQDLQVSLVEDDEGLRATIATQIRSLGCAVRSASDGKSAIELARELPNIDILLSDMVLPGSMDGLKLAKEVASIFPECAVVFMSGFADTSILNNGLSDADLPVLQKPFSVTSLRHALTSAIAE